MNQTRRKLLRGLGVAALTAAAPASMLQAADAEQATTSGNQQRAGGECPFHLAVINDEIDQDFEKACRIAAEDFGLHYIELRGMWDKNITEITPAQVQEAKAILRKHKLQVTDIASPLFKTDWPGAPISDQSEKRDQFHAAFDANAQDKLLEHCIALAKEFGTNRIRCFDFWRLADQKPYRTAINARLQQAAVRCAKDNMILLLENEMSCNTATGEESAAVLAAIPNKNFMLNWDPGNAAALFSTPYPTGYDLLPKNRIGHCHCKDVIDKPNHKYEWAPVGGGVIDWSGQLAALKRDGFRQAVSLETHWRGAGTPEASTRISFEGLKKSLAKAGVNC